MKVQNRIKNIVENRIFKNFIRFIIILNTIVLGIGTSDQITSQLAITLEIVSKICILLYVIEAILEIIAGRLSYFKDGWNVFDFIIVILSHYCL